MSEKLITTKIPHPTSTRYHEVEDSEAESLGPSPKRPRITDAFDKITSPSKTRTLPVKVTHKSPGSQSRVNGRERRDEVPDSDDEYLPEENDGHEVKRDTTTNLETALPSIRTDEEAIEAYEAYKAGQQELADTTVAGPETLHDRLENRTWTRGRTSIYVDAFNLALETVLDQEGHLFNEPEKAVFRLWNELDYEAQYLYVRLFLRKTSAWHRIGRLGYYGDIRDMDLAVLELQKERALPDSEEEPELAFPGEDTLPEEAVPLGSSFRFAECSDDHINTLDEASSLLLLDELKTLAKDAKVNTTGKTKGELLRSLRRTSGRQSGLEFVKRSETEESVQSNGSFGDDSPRNGDDELEDSTSDAGTRTPTGKINRDAHFTAKIMRQTGRCIRLSLLPLKLFERVHLVFYRSTEWTEKSLTTLLLSKISRRNFPMYIVSRSANIFESRSLLLEFEASLRLQFRIDNMLEFNGTPGRREFEEVRRLFEAIYPRWKALVEREKEKEERVYETGEGAYLRRFSPGWVYTRVVHKALAALARAKDHLREHGLLCELLEQKLFHAARRGAWYSRKALLEEHYMYALTDNEGRTVEQSKRHWKRVALRTCEQGLEDRECHVIYHYDLQKRISKLERQLKIPKREQHDFGIVRLRKARERDVHGVQIIADEHDGPPARVRRRDSEGGSRERVSTPNGRRGAKTVWLDELDTGEHVSVEAMCLSHYRKKLGFKGYHSEGGVLKCLFGLLFYDILFELYVPNVFQTSCQTCPLDLHTDAFYSARISEINARINELGNGQAERIIRAVWAEHAERKTCVVGVRWEDYELEDLCEVARCFEGQALGVAMRVLAQEYGGRGGGIPDLFLWKVGDGEEKGKVMFSEVKSENDRLSDTQRLWIDVLLNAGVEVELCHAIAHDAETQM